MRRLLLLMVVGMLLIAGCSTSSAGPTTSDPPMSTTVTSMSDPVSTTAPPTSSRPVEQEFNQVLHDELVAMLERDQAQRMGESVSETDQQRTDRLKQIIAEYGWPTISLVGEDGEDAAWAIAQHSDLDAQFQQQALGLLAAAVEVGEASPGNLAYLTDRIAAGKGEPQVYGTQGGCVDGEPAIGPVVDEENLDARRAEVGLPPIAVYLEEFAEACAQD